MTRGKIMFICESCGNTREELLTYKESRGNFPDGNNSEMVTDCECSCGGNYVEATKCLSCGDWFNDSDNLGGICSSCFDKFADFENALDYGEEEKGNIHINGFLASQFTEIQINEILKRELVEAHILMPLEIDNGARKFCRDNDRNFSKWLREQSKLL